MYPKTTSMIAGLLLLSACSSQQPTEQSAPPSTQATEQPAQSTESAYEALPCQETLCINGLQLGTGEAALAVQTRGVPYGRVEAYRRGESGWTEPTILSSGRAHPKIIEGLSLPDNTHLLIWSDWVPPPASAGQGEGAGLWGSWYREGSWSEAEMVLPSAMSIREPRLTLLPGGAILLTVVEVLTNQQSQLLMFVKSEGAEWLPVAAPAAGDAQYPYEATTLAGASGEIHCVFHTREADDVGRSMPSNVRAFHAVGTRGAAGDVSWTTAEELKEQGLGGARRDLFLHDGVLHAAWYDKLETAFILLTNRWTETGWSEPEELQAEGAAPTAPSFVVGASAPELVFAQSNGQTLNIGRARWSGDQWSQLEGYGPLPGGQLPRARVARDGIEVSWTDMPLGQPKVRTAQLPSGTASAAP